MIFIDTSALYAVIDASDAQHSRARREWDRVLDGDDVLRTSNYVVLETQSLIQARRGVELVRRLVDEILPAIDILWVGEGVHGRAVSALLAANRRQLSLVDCTSFELMREHRIRAAFAFDAHFEEQGFVVQPQSR